MFLVKEKLSPYWQVVYFVNGARKKKSTKRKKKSDALLFLSEFKESLLNNKQSNIITLTEFAKEYLNLIGSIRSKSYLRSIKLSLRSLEKNVGNIPMQELKQQKAEKFILKIFGNSKYAAAMYYRTLKAIFNKAVEWGYILENPFNKFKLLKIPKTLPLFIDYNDLQIILKKTKSELMKDLFLTAFFTGMRLGELINLKWSSVDFKTRIITIKNTDNFTTKSKKERIIPINDSLFTLLKKRSPKIINTNPDEYVFCKNEGIKLNDFFVSKSFKKAVSTSEMDDRIHFHTLRHSFASSLVNNGISLYVIKELLGHKDITTTQVYAHVKNDSLAAAVRSLDL